MQKRLALSVPHFGFNLPEHVGIAHEAEELGYTDAWSFEVDGQDCFAPLALFALHSRMRIGTAIANVYTRGPATLAQSAASIADLAPGRFEFGVGSGSQPIVEQWNSMKFRKPATRVKEMVHRVEGSMAGFLAIAFAFVVLSASFGLMLAALGNDLDVTRGLAIFATLLLVMHGGAWVPSFVFPEWMQQATQFVPTRWAVDGFAAMTWRGLGFEAAIRPILPMLTLAEAMFLLSVWRFRWDE